METINNFLQQTGFSMLGDNWKMLVMIANALDVSADDLLVYPYHVHFMSFCKFREDTLMTGKGLTLTAGLSIRISSGLAQVHTVILHKQSPFAANAAHHG